MVPVLAPELMVVEFVGSAAIWPNLVALEEKRNAVKREPVSVPTLVRWESGFILVGGGRGGSFPPQTLQLPPQKFWPITNIEVTAILGLTLSDVNVRFETAFVNSVLTSCVVLSCCCVWTVLTNTCTHCASDRNVNTYYYQVWAFRPHPLLIKLLPQTLFPR